MYDLLSYMYIVTCGCTLHISYQQRVAEERRTAVDGQICYLRRNKVTPYSLRLTARLSTLTQKSRRKNWKLVTAPEAPVSSTHRTMFTFHNN